MGTARTAFSSATEGSGRIMRDTSVAELSGRTVNYGYDNIYRLTSEAIASDRGGEQRHGELHL